MTQMCIRRLRNSFLNSVNFVCALAESERLLWVDSTYSRAEIADFEHLEDSLIARAAADLKAVIREATASAL